MKAVLRFHKKYEAFNRYIIELSFYELDKSKFYPDGVKYGFICFDSETGNKILMDNHSPKGHHIHINKDEYDYMYVSIDRLFVDFRTLVFENLGVKI
jgi:hypothetical protein